MKQKKKEISCSVLRTISFALAMAGRCIAFWRKAMTLLLLACMVMFRGETSGDVEAALAEMPWIPCCVVLWLLCFLADLIGRKYAAMLGEGAAYEWAELAGYLVGCAVANCVFMFDLKGLFPFQLKSLTYFLHFAALQITIALLEYGMRMMALVRIRWAERRRRNRKVNK